MQPGFVIDVWVAPGINVPAEHRVQRGRAEIESPTRREVGVEVELELSRNRKAEFPGDTAGDKQWWRFSCSRNIETAERRHRRTKMVSQHVADGLREAPVIEKQRAKVFLIIVANDQEAVRGRKVFGFGFNCSQGPDFTSRQGPGWTHRARPNGWPATMSLIAHFRMASEFHRREWYIVAHLICLIYFKFETKLLFVLILQHGTASASLLYRGGRGASFR